MMLCDFSKFFIEKQYQSVQFFGRSSGGHLCFNFDVCSSEPKQSRLIIAAAAAPRPGPAVSWCGSSTDRNFRSARNRLRRRPRPPS